MKPIFAFLAAILACFPSYGQFISVELEPHVIHAGPTPDGVDLSGYITYRLYVNLGHESDFCSSVYGDVEFPLVIESTTGFWQSPFGGLTGPDINPLLLPAFPSLEFDSFVTIGRATSGEPGGAVNSIESNCDQWATSFNAGGAIEMDCLFGGAWFALNGDSNGLAGDDLRVLIGQFTTNGELSGTINVQVFPLGVGANEERIAGISFSSNPNAVFGCTDPGALNYNEQATEDNGTCVYPCGLVVSSVLISPNNCTGDDNAEIFIETSGGQGLISYRLNGGDFQLSPIFDDLTAGLYFIEVQDAQGCLDVYDLTIEDPELFTISAVVTSPISCAGDANGEITVIANGGTGTALFGLSPDNISSDLPQFTGLLPGSYTVYAMDDNGCTVVSDELSLENPDPMLIMSILTVASECGNEGNGSLSVSVSGGTGQKMYSLDGVNFQINGSFAGLATGNYTVYVQDANMCEITIPLDMPGPAPVIAAPVIMDNFCAQGSEGSADLNLSGGEGNILVSLNGGEFTANEVFSNLTVGIYEVEVLDEANFCMFTLEFEVAGGPEVIFDYISDDVSCAGESDGVITIQAEGGYGNLQYALPGNSFDSDAVLSDVPAGNQTVLISDQEGCIYSFEAEVGSPDPLQLSGEVVPDQGGGNGEIQIGISGGVPPYATTWSGPDGFISEQQNITMLSEGVYSVTITDANGCEVSETFNLPLGIWNFALGEAGEMLVFPNPVRDIATFQLPFTLTGDTELTFYDAQGKLVLSIGLPAGDNFFYFDTMGLGSGIFMVTLQTGNKRLSARMVIM